MISIIQVVANSDRYHVCINEIPQRTLLIKDYLSPQICLHVAESFAYRLAIENQNDDFEILLKPLKQD